MKRTPRSRKTPSYLPESIRQSLNMYAAAATATGVGVLALAQHSEAKIIYTPAHKTIDFTHKVLLDLNHDGKIDFTFQETLITTTSVDEFHSLILSVVPAQSRNEVWTKQKHASALPAGIRIGPKGPFASGKRAMALDYYADGTGGSGTCAGPWNNVQKRYLGLKFRIEGATHFGWVRLNVTCVTHNSSHQITGLLTGYAYETIPNKAIITGKTVEMEEGSVEDTNSATLNEPNLRPPSLGLLAIGASRLSIWRREESAPEGN